VDSQPLLQAVQLGVSRLQQLPRLRSFGQWMLRRASQHASLLDLKLGTQVAAEAEESRATALLAAACGAACCLTDLRLELTPESHAFNCTSWIAALHSLWRLTIATTGYLFVRVSLQPLTALQEMTLDGVGCSCPPKPACP
jgi:hypothetical protein